MATYNKTILVGNLTRDPDLRFTTSGKPVCNFDIAINHHFKNAKGETVEETVFIPVTIWGKQAESTGQYMKKGRLVLVDGRLFQDRWEDKDGKKRSSLKLNASTIQFLGSPKGKEEPKPEPDNQSAQE